MNYKINLAIFYCIIKSASIFSTSIVLIVILIGDKSNLIFGKNKRPFFNTIPFSLVVSIVRELHSVILKFYNRPRSVEKVGCNRCYSLTSIAVAITVPSAIATVIAVVVAPSIVFGATDNRKCYK